jgi:hypothetical protein
MDSYEPDRQIPHIALYLCLRGKYGHKRCPHSVNEARAFARSHADLGLGAEALIRELYGIPSRTLAELDRRYGKLSQQLKQGIPWQAAAELFAAGEIKRVMRLF